ncbi:MAG: gluconolaconase, partial [Acidobacteriota bacterium]
GLASHDAIYAIDKSANVEKFALGFGRPQGIAFDREGNLYTAACYAGHHGIFRISPDGLAVTRIVAGNNIVGLCFTRNGQMIVATNDSVYSLNASIHGTLV